MFVGFCALIVVAALLYAMIVAIAKAYGEDQ